MLIQVSNIDKPLIQFQLGKIEFKTVYDESLTLSMLCVCLIPLDVYIVSTHVREFNT